MKRQLKRFNRNWREREKESKKSKQSTDALSRICLLIERSALNGIKM